MPSFFRTYGQFLLVLIACCAIHAFIFLRSIPVYYLPDLALILYLVYKFKDLNQEVTPLFFVGLGLLIGFFLLSPEPAQTEFPNNYIVTLKPFAYICILALYSRNPPQIDLSRCKNVFEFVPTNIALEFIFSTPSRKCWFGAAND